MSFDNTITRDITRDDIERVHTFILEEQGRAAYECDKKFIEAGLEKGFFRIDGEIHYSYEEEGPSSKSDYLKWIVDSEGLQFGKIAVLNGKILGVLLCYTQPENRKAFLSNIAVARHHRRKGIGSILMNELLRFYRAKSGIETIELNVALTNSIAVKFYLEHNFKIAELRDTGYTMQYALVNMKI